MKTKFKTPYANIGIIRSYEYDTENQKVLYFNNDNQIFSLLSSLHYNSYIHIYSLKDEVYEYRKSYNGRGALIEHYPHKIKQLDLPFEL